MRQFMKKKMRAAPLFLFLALLGFFGCGNEEEKEDSSSWIEHPTTCFECSVVSIDEPNSLVFASVNMQSQGNEASTTYLPHTIKFKTADCPGHRFKLGETLYMRITMIWDDSYGMPVTVPFCKVKMCE